MRRGTLLPIVGHRLFGDDTCIHELAHAVELRAMTNAARHQVVTAYKQSIASGHWDKQYAAKNESEWFAEMTKYYFRSDRSALAFYNPSLAHDRAWLCKEDADACRFIEDVYSGKLDVGTPHTVQLQLQPGELEPSLRSAHSDSPTIVTIRNHTAARVHAMWVDFQGNRDTRPGAAE